MENVSGAMLGLLPRWRLFQEAVRGSTWLTAWEVCVCVCERA